MAPLVHVSSRYPAQRHCLAVVAPVAPVPGRPNEVVVYDLAEDPEAFLALDADELRDRLYTPRADLPEGVARLPLKTVKANRSPALAPLSVLEGVDLARIGVDLDRAQRHAARLRTSAGLSARLGALFEPAAEATPGDVELALYASFVPNVDKPLLKAVRTTPPAGLAALAARFHDTRYPELLFRYRARNWPRVAVAGGTGALAPIAPRSTAGTQPGRGAGAGRLCQPDPGTARHGHGAADTRSSTRWNPGAGNWARRLDP